MTVRAGRTVLAALTLVAALGLPAAVGAGPESVGRAAMAVAVTKALALPPTRLGPRYADVAPSSPDFGAIEAGADANLWGTWRPGARFRPGAPATFGAALAALVVGLGGARVIADEPGGLGRAARALGLWPGHAPALGAPLTPGRLAWLERRARLAQRSRLVRLESRLVRGVLWLGGGPVAAGETVALAAVAVDRSGYALPAALALKATAGRIDAAGSLYTAPTRTGEVTITARARDGVRAHLLVRVVAPLTLALADPGVVPSGRTAILDVAVDSGGTVFAGDSGRVIHLTYAQGRTYATLTAVDDMGLAPFRLPPLRPGPVRVTVVAAGLSGRTVTRTLTVADDRPGAPDTAADATAPRPDPAPAHGPFSGKGLWLPYWIDEAMPAARIVREAKAAGAHTLYLEVATSADGVYGRPGLGRLLRATRGTGIDVVAWIYADLAAPAQDFANLRAVLAFGTGGQAPAGIALDLEGNVPLPRWALTAELALARRRLGARGQLLAVTYPNGPLAPPYGLVARYATAIAPMDYWHGTLTAMSYAAAYIAVRASVAAIRSEAPGVAVSPILQAFDLFTPSGRGPYAPTAAELSGAIAAARAAGSLGLSFYQMGTVSKAEWAVIDAAPPPLSGR